MPAELAMKIEQHVALMGMVAVLLIIKLTMLTLKDKVRHAYKLTIMVEGGK